ncbi:MAG: hypothetical protein NXI31_25665 [bacterium]|nr:hypothetical protein [bacterium]
MPTERPSHPSAHGALTRTAPRSWSALRALGRVVAGVLALGSGSVAVAQCGTQALTTPPAFVANNGGEIGGVVYFSLAVDGGGAPNGVSICGFDVHTSVLGQPITGIVYLHQSITDVAQLNGSNNGSADWCRLGALTGQGNGAGLPSPMTVVNPTNSIDLPPGDYLFALGNGDFDHDYTFGTGCGPGFNECVSDGVLTFTAGKASNTFPNGSPLFSPRVFNATVRYDVATAAVTRSPCEKAAVTTNIGNSCGGGDVTLVEDFGTWDLTDGTAQPPTTTDVVFSGQGGTITVDVVAGGSAIVPPTAPDLGLGDDDVSALIPLGFDLKAFGLPCADSIAVQSNGCIWLGFVGNDDYLESIASFERDGARIAPFWEDLRPLTGGGRGMIHVDQGANSTTVTWSDVLLWGTPRDVTFQCVIEPTRITCRYDADSPFPDDGLVGFTNGVGAVGTPNLDLTAATPVTVAGGPQLGLRAVSAPTIRGSAFGIELLGLPAGGIAAVLATIGNAGAGTPLPPPVLPSCRAYVPFNAVNIGTIVAANPCVTYPFSLAVPNDPSFVCLPLTAQGAALELGSGNATLSNAVEAMVGDV